MRLRITTTLPDKLRQAPPIEDDFTDGLLLNYAHYKLGALVEDELFTDEGQVMPVGTTITVERIA